MLPFFFFRETKEMHFFVYTFPVTGAESGAELTTAIRRHVNKDSCPWHADSNR